MIRASLVFLFLLVCSISIFVSLAQAQQSYSIPSWIKNNAKWWSEGQISDSDFINGTQYLLQQEIIHMPKMAVQPVAYHQIPAWIKNYAGSWANSSASDYNFFSGIQYLIQADLIHVNVTQKSNQKTSDTSIPTTCKAVNDILPDPKCTPGATDPKVTQANIDSTICISGYTKTLRPSGSVTNPIKLLVMQAYGFTDSPGNYELDHLIPLELGGAPEDVKNLWPESYYTNPSSYDKDGFENYLHNQVCSGAMDLKTAQDEISYNWVKYWAEIHSTTLSKIMPNTQTNATSQDQTSQKTQSLGTLYINLQGPNVVSRGNIQSMTVTITNGTNPISGASVFVTVTYASEQTTKYFDGTSNFSGQYNFDVEVDASKSGYLPVHKSFTFLVVPAY
jgi:hypothetical protein